MATSNIERKNILCVPLDPVHDVGIKLIRNELQKRGHNAELLSPDLTVESIVKKAATGNYDFILVSRTLGYGVAELLARFIDLLDAAGVRERAKIIIGGKPITPQLAAEIGFDKGFGEHSSIEEVVAFIEGREVSVESLGLQRSQKDITAKYTYKFHHKQIGSLLGEITEKLIEWSKDKTSPGVKRSRLRQRILETSHEIERESLEREYQNLCNATVVDGNSRKIYPKGVRRVSERELSDLKSFLRHSQPYLPRKIQHNDSQPIVFKFLGSGCPIMDIAHGKICERWGIDGFLIINPSWEARYEGLLQGYLTHENDGTITSLENIRLMREGLDKNTLLTVRAHRGLNTPETVLLAGEAGSGLTKINLVYGSLGAGTDPERLAIDGIEAIRLAAKYKMPFDIPGNDELSGVPAWKTLAGLLINVMLGMKLGAKPILKPLFCYGPHIMIHGQMKENFVDYNAAKIFAMREIVDCPIWPGEPIAFMTQTEERVQSANTTSYHAALAASLGVDAITIASTDEAYSRGPICIASRIDSIRAVSDAFRFVGNSHFAPSRHAETYVEELVDKIVEVLQEVNRKANLPEAISMGLLGNEEDGAYPGKFGRGTVETA
jgi:methylmalonyl-CoA mutase cobalamin-binding subunit